MDATDGIKIGIDVVTTIVGQVWKNYHSKLSPSHSDPTTITNFTSEIQNKTYSLLYQNIFLPLRQNLTSSIANYYFIPMLEFDSLNVRNSDYWEEGHKHLVEDIEKFDDKLSWLESNIVEYNNDLEKFEKEGRQELVANYFEENGFNITNDVSNIPSNNTILIRILLDRLKNYWKSKEDFRLVWDDELLKINNVETIASAPSENRTKIENCIKYLKDSDKVLKAYYDLVGYYENINKEAEKLSKEIGKKVILKIEKGTYKTICDECLN